VNAGVVTPLSRRERSRCFNAVVAANCAMAGCANSLVQNVLRADMTIEPSRRGERMCRHELS